MWYFLTEYNDSFQMQQTFQCALWTAVQVNVCVCVFDQVMLELAQLYLTLDDVEACQQQCSAILKNDPVNKSPTLVSFLKQMLLSHNLTPLDQSIHFLNHCLHWNWFKQ